MTRKSKWPTKLESKESFGAKEAPPNIVELQDTADLKKKSYERKKTASTDADSFGAKELPCVTVPHQGTVSIKEAPETKKKGVSDLKKSYGKAKKDRPGNDLPFAERFPTDDIELPSCGDIEKRRVNHVIAGEVPQDSERLSSNTGRYASHVGMMQGGAPPVTSSIPRPGAYPVHGSHSTENEFDEVSMGDEEAPTARGENTMGDEQGSHFVVPEAQVVNENLVDSVPLEPILSKLTRKSRMNRRLVVAVVVVASAAVLASVLAVVLGREKSDTSLADNDVPGYCDDLLNTADFDYDGGDCCQATCVSTAEQTCGHVARSAFGLPSQKFYVGYPSCIDPDQLCDPPDEACWKQIYEVAGAATGSNLGNTVALSGNGAVFAATTLRGNATVGVVNDGQIFEQDGSRWLRRGRTFVDVSIMALSDNGDVVAVVSKSSRIVQAFEWQPRTREWIQLGDDIVDVWPLTLALSGDGETLAVAKLTNNTGVLDYYLAGYHYDSWTGWTELPGWNITVEGVAREISLSSNGTTLAITWVWSGRRDRVKVYEYDRLSKSTSTVVEDLGVGTDWELEEVFYLQLSSDGRSLSFADRVSNDTGQVLVLDARDWRPRGSPIIISDNNVTKWSYGNRVSLSGDGQVLAIGFPGTLNTRDSESVQVYKYDSGMSEWMPQGPAIVTPHDGFGWALSLSDNGSTLLIGAQWAFLNDMGASGLVSVYGNTVKAVPGDLPGATLSPSPAKVPITTVIEFDRIPEELGISMNCDGMSFVSASAGSFRRSSFSNETVKDVFLVPEGSICDFTITDSEGDGFYAFKLDDIRFIEGYFEIYYGDDDVPSQANLLARGGSQGSWFGTREKVSFTASPPISALVPFTLAFEGRTDDDVIAREVYLRCEDGVLEFDNPLGLFKVLNETETIALTYASYWLPAGTKCAFEIENKYYTFLVFDGEVVPTLDDNGQLQILEERLLYRWNVKNATVPQSHLFTVSPGGTAQVIDVP